MARLLLGGDGIRVLVLVHDASSLPPARLDCGDPAGSAWRSPPGSSPRTGAGCPSEKESPAGACRAGQPVPAGMLSRFGTKPGVSTSEGAGPAMTRVSAGQATRPV